jgi:hypothetical protein
MAPVYRYRDAPKGIKLPNGNRLSHGQLFTTPETNPMQRPLNSMYSARNGAPKKIIDAPIKPGMKRQTVPSTAYLHGAPALDDEKEQPLKSYEKPIAVHPSMTSKQAAEHAASPSAKAIFADAARLGRKDK